MSTEIRTQITSLLRELEIESTNRRATTERLLEALYPELRRLAAALFRQERASHTLEPTALVHEAYIRLVDQDGADWKNRAHFLGVSARIMRQVLVDHARHRLAEKRGGGWERVTLSDAVELARGDDVDLLDLEDALERFATVDPRAARVVELRVFGGLTVEETAHVLEVAARTVDGDWAMARMWLGKELREDST
jgi:RNA polymerase sigma-70 factor (ECF subfamily)